MGTPARLAPSLYERYPGAMTAPRTVPNPASVPVYQIIGTVAQPSQHGVAFRPIKPWQTRNWDAIVSRLWPRGAPAPTT